MCLKVPTRVGEICYSTWVTEVQEEDARTFLCLCLLVVLIKRSHVSTKTLKMGHRDARGGCKGTRREAVEKGFVNLPPLCTLHFALCTLYFVFCIVHFVLQKGFPNLLPLCTLYFALCTSKRFLHLAATLHHLLSRLVAAPRPYSWCQRMCGKGLNL